MPETDHSLFFQGRLAGLCGNFDLKTVNEMRTPENLELTNPQEFGGSWAAVEVKPLQADSLPSPRWTLVSTERTWPQVRGEGRWCKAAPATHCQPLTWRPQPYGLRTCTIIPYHKSVPGPRPGRRAGAGKETESLP